LTEKKENSSNEVLRHVIGMVVSGRVLPEEVLYETTIAAETGLSRTPVREAMMRLVSDGFLGQTKGRRGYAVPALTPEDMRNVYHARECIEQKVALLAAEKAVKSDVDTLMRINELDISGVHEAPEPDKAIYTRDNEWYSAVDLNVRFHIGVARIARNKYLERMYEMVYWRSHLYTHYVIRRMPFPPAVEDVFQRRKRENLGAHEHRELIDAIAARDGDLASKLTIKHLRNTTYYAVAFDINIQPMIDGWCEGGDRHSCP
jgi:DNA-binding GntR family transcriptional regulator